MATRTSNQGDGTDQHGRASKRRRVDRLIGRLVKLAIALAGLYALVVVAFSAASDNEWGWIAVVVLVWLALVLLAAAGPDGREESHRILEAPSDERERAIRSRAFGASFAALVVFCVGWFTFSVIEDRESIVPMLAIALGLVSVVAAIEFLRRRT